MNGTSALLHLVRAKLHQYLDPKRIISLKCLFDPKKMRERVEHKPDSAIRILADDENMRLEVFPGANEQHDETEEKWTGEENTRTKSKRKKQACILFEHVVQDHYRNLEVMFDYQRLKAGPQWKEHEA